MQDLFPVIVRIRDMQPSVIPFVDQLIERQPRSADQFEQLAVILRIADRNVGRLALYVLGRGNPIHRFIQTWRSETAGHCNPPLPRLSPQWPSDYSSPPSHCPPDGETPRIKDFSAPNTAHESGRPSETVAHKLHLSEIRAASRLRNSAN